jgi:hypothetical protein
VIEELEKSGAQQPLYIYIYIYIFWLNLESWVKKNFKNFSKWINFI